MRIISFFCLTISLVFCAITHAQNPLIRHYTTLNGLPSNTIYQIYQDSQKFLWFTSEAGVVKFDGSQFITFRKKDGLSSNDVVRIKEDLKGRIWLFNYNGSVNYVYNNTIYNSKNAPFLNSLIGKGFIVDFFTDSNQTIYFYNWQREVFMLDKNNRVTKEVLLKNIALEIPYFLNLVQILKVQYLAKNKQNDWVVWCNCGIFSHDFRQNSRIAVVDSGLHCSAVFPVSGNNYYVNTYTGGLLKITGNLEKQKIFLPFNSINIRTIIEDTKGYLWVAANNEGVYCLKDNKVVKQFKIPNALGLLEDHERNIWVSTQSDGIFIINSDVLGSNHFERTNFEGYGINQLFGFTGLGIWCTNTRSVYLLNNNTFYNLNVPKVLQLINILGQYNTRTLIIGSKSHLLFAYQDPSLSVLSKQVKYRDRKKLPIVLKKIITDKSGEVLTMVDQSRIFTTPHITPLFNPKFKFVDERISNAYYSAKNELVINASKNFFFRNNKLVPNYELARFNGSIITDHLVLDTSTEVFAIDGDSLFILKDHKFYNLSEAFDMPVDLQIIKILNVDSILYLATLKEIFVCNNALNVLSGNPVHIEPLNISFNNINDMIIHNDTLFVASNDGLTCIAEKTFTTSVALPPIPYLKSVSINDMPYTIADQEIKLTGKNTIRLSFGCISYSASPVIYSYRLQGAENKWVTGSGSGINLVYQNLSKGQYVFELRVRKSNSAWSKPTRLGIKVQPTLVEYPLFWIFVALFLIGLTVLIIVRYRIIKMRRIEVDHQLIVMEQKALQSMMNPHFIFNSLGSIQNYLLKNNGAEAVIYLTQFARLIRQNLNAVNNPMVALDEEIDRLRNYIDLEKKRLENKFEYSIEIDPQLEDEGAFIPSMIIQPIVENSIWHGIATLEEKGSIRISFSAYKPKSLMVMIEDNGIGLKKSLEYSVKSSQNQRLGMKIIKKRLELLGKKYGTETSMHYSEKTTNSNPPGVVVQLIIPFVYSPDEI